MRMPARSSGFRAATQPANNIMLRSMIFELKIIGLVRFLIYLQLMLEAYMVYILTTFKFSEGVMLRQLFPAMTQARWSRISHSII